MVVETCLQLRSHYSLASLGPDTWPLLWFSSIAWKNVDRGSLGYEIIRTCGGG